jgi:cysteine desulfurase
MSSFAPTVARQALRIASRRYPASAFARTSLRTAAARRSYVSETKSHNATVNIDTTIQAEKKAFLNQTGERAEDATMPTTGMSADAMMSPTAGECRHPARNVMREVSDGC